CKRKSLRQGSFMSLSRRYFLQHSISAALFAAASSINASPTTQTSFFDYPFKLGVASGDPLPDSVVLWTRLAPAPYEDSALPSVPIIVEWEISRDPRLKKILRRGRTLA